MVSTTDADRDVLGQLIDLILVAETEHFLILSLLVRVVPIELGDFLRVLNSLQKLFMDHSTLVHELTHTVDRVVIEGCIIVWR